MEKRIVELEKKAAFQENTIDELNQALLDQQKRLDKLERELKQAKDYIQSGDFVRKIEDEEPPPHY